MADDADSLRPVADRLVTGRLVQHGAAPLTFKAGAPPSYFVRIETDSGPRDFWGQGLRRALANSITKPEIGDEIGVRQNSVEPVVFMVRTQDARGNTTAVKRAETPRPHWVIEKKEFFDERAVIARTLRDERVHPRDAIRDHRELVGAYLLIDAAKKIASQKIKTPEGGQRFVALVRESLALLAERGEPLAVARIREVAQRAPEVPERASTHTLDGPVR